MTAQLRSELFKLRTTRTSLALALGMLALVVLVTALNGFVTSNDYLMRRNNQFQLLANGSIASAFAALLGVLAITGEFRHGTIRPTLLASPRRAVVIGAKLVAGTLAGIVLGVVGIAVSFGLGELALSTHGIPVQLDGRDLALVVAGGIGASALWGAFGVGFGAAVRNQVGAIAGLLVWSLFVESIVFALVPSVGRYLPGEAANALTQIGIEHRLAVLPGTLVFVGYVVVLAALGLAVTERRDVS